jgi:hypothetical protein
LRALMNKSVALKKKKTIWQKGGFLGSLLAPIASVVAPLLSTILQWNPWNWWDKAVSYHVAMGVLPIATARESHGHVGQEDANDTR